jgi:16S rRNA C1402 (ribose-2'-O) methylase RsmI
MLSKAKSNSASAYKKIVAFESQLRINEKLMDLKKVNIPEDSMLVIEEVLRSPNKLFRPKEFAELYEEDDLGKSINNLQSWLFEKFHALSKYEQ